QVQQLHQLKGVQRDLLVSALQGHQHPGPRWAVPGMPIASGNAGPWLKAGRIAQDRQSGLHPGLLPEHKRRVSFTRRVARQAQLFIPAPGRLFVIVLVAWIAWERQHLASQEETSTVGTERLLAPIAQRMARLATS